jgi:hypothetical protein
MPTTCAVQKATASRQCTGSPARADIHDAERKLTRDNGSEKRCIGLCKMCFDHEAKRARHHYAGNKPGDPRRQEGGAERRSGRHGYGCRKR